MVFLELSILRWLAPSVGEILYSARYVVCVRFC